MAAIDDVQVVRYRRADRERVFTFLRAVYPSDYSLRLIRQWDWKYEQNPFNPDGEPHILLLQDDQQLIGMYGRLFFRSAIDGAPYLIHHGCDLVVHPAYRGHGLSARLRHRDLIQSAAHFSWQNDASYRVAQRDGTAGVPYRALVRPLHAHVMSGHVTGEHWLTDATARVIYKALQYIAPLGRDAAASDIAVGRIVSFDERFDQLWHRSGGAYRAMIVRDRRYLDWRFTQRPDAEYRIAAATRGGVLVGYIVTRCVDRDGDRWGYLVDFLVEESSAPVFAALVADAVDDLREQGATLVMCHIAVPPYRSMLYRHGLLPWPRAPKGYLRLRMRQSLPSPVEARQWFLTMGDGDLEMAL